MSLIIPEVGLISSWALPTISEGICGLRVALRNRINIHDLYFLHHSDLPWFEAQLSALRDGNAATAVNDPLGFVASLDPPHLDCLAERLNRLLTEEYAGPLVGPRPRFAALATYWPLISLPDDEDPGFDLREKSIRALQNSLYLAARLGCKCVEIVGGSAVPESEKARAHPWEPSSYREVRRKTYAESLISVFSDKRAKDLRSRSPNLDFPAVALEIEPGASFLLNQLSEYSEIRDLLASDLSDAQRKTLLNIDVAHFMLLDEPSEDLLKKLRGLRDQVAHFHLSDHARTHAADLTPGTYHVFNDFRPWLEFAIDLCERGSQFSRFIAIELEACNDIHEASRAVGKVRRWLDEIKRQREDAIKPRRNKFDERPTLTAGALLVVDIGSSTESFLGDSNSEADGALRVEDAVGHFCDAVHRERGSVLSFTGDGVIAFFNQRDFQNTKAVSLAALHVARAIAAVRQTVSSDITLRVALHWGMVYIPVAGRLRYQAIGRHVVIAARLCDWIAKAIEVSIPQVHLGTIVAATGQFHEQLPGALQGEFRNWGSQHFKGLEEQFTIHLDTKGIDGAPSPWLWAGVK